jgi:hypothetical protein
VKPLGLGHDDLSLDELEVSRILNEEELVRRHALGDLHGAHRSSATISFHRLEPRDVRPSARPIG